jgi:mRNA interferase RelE/StbE
MKIIFEEKALKQLKKLPINDKKIIIQKIEQLQEFPNVSNTKKLKNYFPPFRLRINHYRVLFDIENSTIIIFEIIKRKDAYK